MPHLYNMDEATAFSHVTYGTAKRLKDEGYIAYPDSEEPLDVQQQPREQSNSGARSQLNDRETTLSPKTTPEAQYLQEENRQLKAENARLKLLWENAQLRAENARLRQTLVDHTLKASIAASSTIDGDHDLLSDPISDLQGFDAIPASRADSQTAEQVSYLPAWATPEFPRTFSSQALSANWKQGNDKPRAKSSNGTCCEICSDLTLKMFEWKDRGP
ncbi:hypothetical protein BKA80DRAFT_7712 [Phyllosticta citrichinensis]